jgi:Flp pilus assembly protein TadG
MQLKHQIRFAKDQHGATAVEFAIVGPVFLLLVIGMIYTCMLLFSMASMQYAVEEGARCASVKTTVCTDSASIVAYTQNAYYGPLNSPTFTYSTPACGHQVSSSTNFAFDIGLSTLTVPLAATACFP